MSKENSILSENALDAGYWNQRYEVENTPWNLNSMSIPLNYLVKLYTRPNHSLLIPGAGMGHELNWLHEHGFTKAVALDWSSEAIESSKMQYPEIPQSAWIQGDFFEHDERYDCVLEQTFFCALAPKQRKDYVNQVSRILKPGSILMGVWFHFPLTEKGPPFGGNHVEYRILLKDYFDFLRFEPCRISIPERTGQEWMVVARKK